MKDFSKKELENMLLQSVKCFIKLYYTNSHEYSEEFSKMFTTQDYKIMQEIISKLDLSF